MSNANEIPEGHTIEGETFQQWVTRQFEAENCEECGQDETGHDAAIVMGNWFARCKPQPVTDVIFRVWRIKGGGVIALFPADPDDAAGKYCASFEHVGQHSGADYAMVMQRTRAARPEEYADLQKELESQPYRYRLRICKRRNAQHRREFNDTLKSWLTRNQDSGVKSTLAPGSDTQPPKHVIYNCGICSCYHPWDFNGDCRDDKNRFATPEDFLESIGLRDKDGDVLEVRSMEDRMSADSGQVLDSTIDTPEMQDRIAAAAKKALLIPEGPLQVDYEHGQWWITNKHTGAQWSVVDASGPGSTDGFDFEKVTEGDAD